MSHPKKHLTPVSLLIYDYNNGHWTPEHTNIYYTKLVKSYLNITNYAFDPDQVLTIDFELPPNVKYLRVWIMDDTILNIPYIAKVYN